MSTKTHSKKLLWIAMASGLSVLGLGCGTGSPVAPVGVIPSGQAGVNPVNGACAAGSILVGNLCYFTTDLTTACTWAGGKMVAAPQGNLCQVKIRSYLSSTVPYRPIGNAIPRLTANDPVATYTAFRTDLNVRAGDQVYFKGSGGWGTTSSGFVIFGFGGLNTCDGISLDGSKDGVVSTYAGHPVGFMGGDGVEVYFLGSEGTAQIENNGNFRIGFNTNSVSNACADFRILELSQIRCSDSSGTAYPCPAS